MIADQQWTFELAHIIDQRLADAARERLLREAERARGAQPPLAARVGALLIRAGRRLEILGGVPQPAPTARPPHLPRYSL